MGQFGNLEVRRRVDVKKAMEFVRETYRLGAFGFQLRERKREGQRRGD